MAAGATSKAFRASILRLTDHQINLLHRWAVNHCAVCSVLAGPTETMILVCLKDQRRTAASFARTIRSATRSLAVPTTKSLTPGKTMLPAAVLRWFQDVRQTAAGSTILPDVEIRSLQLFGEVLCRKCTPGSCQKQKRTPFGSPVSWRSWTQPS